MNPKKAGSSDHILIPCGTTDGNKVRIAADFTMICQYKLVRQYNAIMIVNLDPSWKEERSSMCEQVLWNVLLLGGQEGRWPMSS